MAAIAHRVGKLADFPEGEARRVEVEGRAVLVVRLGDQVYALGDTCTHEDYSLSEGEVDPEERTVECWKHGSLFSLEDGQPLTLPATKPTATYDVRVSDGEIEVVVE